MRNLKLALRALGRTPFVTTVAALSLGLGIGANSAIYSIFYRMVRQELPVRDADRLVNFSAPGPKNGSTSCGQAGSCDDVFSYPMFRDLQNAKLSALLPVENLRPMPEEIRINTFEDRMITTLAASFALLATLLASIGLYGVLAYSIAQRTREIGVRMALGADAGDVRFLVLRQVGVMTAIGGAIGLAGALALSKGAQSILYQMSGADPVVMTAAVAFLALVALAAGYVPALRASRVSPIQALRYE